jgi:hypothetical protein
MILILQLVVLLKQLLHTLREVIRAQACLGRTQVVQALIDPHRAQRRASEDRVVDELEECGFGCGRETVVD